MAEIVLPYRPSWIDKLTAWIGRLPLPAWLFYLGLGLCLTLLLVSSIWLGGLRDLRTILPYYFLEAMTFAYLLALIHYLDNSALVALARFRPVMTVDDAGYELLCYQLTTLPARPTLVASALGIAYGLVALLLNIVSNVNPGAVAVPPAVIVVDVAFRLLIYVMVAVLVYHTLHQLWMVNLIYTTHTHINLFQPGPLYSWSRLTALTAIGISIPTYLWFEFNRLSAPGTSASDILQTAFLSILIGVTFVWPLLGAHELLAREKQRLQDEAGRRVEATITVLQSRIDAGDLAEIGSLKETLDGLMTAQGIINRLRTWPWRTETVSGVGLTFLVPIVTWVAQRVLERFGL